VTQAARELNLTQSATSAAVAALEARYATKLFDRVGRRIALTEAGRLFLAEARAVLARAATAEAVLTDLAGLERGSLRVAASQTVGNYWLPRIFCRYRSLYPRIAVELVIGTTPSAAALAHEAAVDFAVVEGETEDPTLVIEAVAEDELKLVAHPDHPWTARPPGPGVDLAAARWVLRERGSGTRGIFDAALAGFGVDAARLDVAFELPTHEAIRSAVEAGAGVAILPGLVAATALKAGSLVEIDLVLPKRRFFALRRKERHLTQAARAFRALLTRDDGGPLATRRTGRATW
jgi:DNA-binding transcriptional LysR family regulator